jgi:benzoyl-CoA 2,3-dioxygenase component A
MNAPDAAVIKQHLIDPEICIRCNTCESICPVQAITHDSRNYVVDASKCNFCMDCISPCPTGSIDNWRLVPKSQPYTLDEQFSWDDLPAEKTREQLAELGVAEAATDSAEDLVPQAHMDAAAQDPTGEAPFNSSAFGATTPPWSAAHAYANLYGPKAADKFVTATVVGNVRVTEVGTDYDTHHLMLDFGAMPFPVLEGQSIGIIPPGVDERGKPHHPRQYSIASPRNGERPGYNNISLTIKRVLEDHQGKPVRGVASNYMCDLKVGDTVQVTGPFGTSFLMPNHPRSNIIMICTGTGSAPMRAMTEWRRRLRKTGKFEADAVLWRPHAARTAVLRPAARLAQGLHRHQLRLQPHARRGQEVRAARAARTRRRCGAALAGRQHLHLRLRPEKHGRGRGAGAARRGAGCGAQLGRDRRPLEEGRPAAPGNLLSGSS